jgi:hypothetical protein
MSSTKTLETCRAMTLKELASQLNLSVTTVSDALKETPSGYVAPETRRRVRREATRLGYEPNVHARRLVTRRADDLITGFAARRPADLSVGMTRKRVPRRAADRRLPLVDVSRFVRCTESCVKPTATACFLPKRKKQP